MKKHEVVIPRTVMKEVQRKIQSSAAEIVDKDKEKDKRSTASAKALHSAQSTRRLSDDLKTDHPLPAEHEIKNPEDAAETSHNSTSASISEAEGPPAPPTPKTAVVVPVLPSRPPLLRVVSSTFFTQDDGGLCSVDPMTGKEGNEVYYLGIIDILQRYNALKKVEHGMKALTHDAASVSCAPPSFYAERFLHSVGQRMLGVDESLVWVGASTPGRGESMSLEEMMEIGRQSSDDPP